MPAIIYCSGHTNEGYRNPVYQHAILNLVNKGFVVFAFDPIGQGERYQYYDPATGKPIIGERDEEHSYAGAQPFIIGSSLARYMIWDGIRAIDYLTARPEVDAQRIGITGRSGGGTQSAYIAAFDERIKAVAPANYITNFKRLIESVGPQCAEQDFFHGISTGLDIPDLLIVRAPRPALIVATTRDQIFSIQGAIEAKNEVAHIYDAYHMPQQLTMATDDALHASTKKGREAIYAFFRKYLNNPGNAEDMEVPLLSPAELQVTPTGQVSTSLGGETVYSLNKKETEKFLKKLDVSRKANAGNDRQILEAARRLSGFRQPVKESNPVFNGRFQRDGYVVEKYFIKGEGNYPVPYLVMRPGVTNHKAVIYLNPKGKSADASEGGTMEWFAKKGFTVLAPELLGFGEMGPGVFKGDSYIQGVSYNVWFLSMLIGRSIAGVQAGDVVRLVNVLKKEGDIEEIYGLAKSGMSPVMTHAAAFDSSFKRIALIEPYTSYRSIAMTRFYNPHDVHSIVPGALTTYDLPDLASLLAPKRLYMVNVKAAAGADAGKEIEDADFSVISNAYTKRKAENRFKLFSVTTDKEMKVVLEDWANDDK